jgi:hypothetical protein
LINLRWQSWIILNVNAFGVPGQNFWSRWEFFNHISTNFAFRSFFGVGNLVIFWCTVVCYVSFWKKKLIAEGQYWHFA